MNTQNKEKMKLTQVERELISILNAFKSNKKKFQSVFFFSLTKCDLNMAVILTKKIQGQCNSVYN